MQAIKTDLRLLLECLKYQMKWPDSQKQALLTILSICKQNDQYVEFLIEIGGISFIYNLSKSSAYAEVKQTALFTLASIAELNESCKQTLCREETFRDLAQHLEQEMPVKQKRVAVYMLGVLVANNRCGQTFAKTFRCIEILLNLFRYSFPKPNDCPEQLQTWAAVSSALCCSVNNPQNEENQNACMHVFPLVITWLQEVALPRAELAQPICSFIGMTVANNSCAQEYFVSAGGLDSLSNTLTRVLPQSAHSPAACKMATVITKTLSACICNNELLVSSLPNVRVIPGLLCLLSSPNLDPQDQLSVLLTIGQLTDACVEHQSQLLHGGGLALMISLLTEAADEEVRRAAMFVLHTCKRITESLCEGVSIKDEEGCDMERHWQSAGEILQRIQQLETKIGVKHLNRDECQEHSMQRSASSVECREEWLEVKGHHLAHNPVQPIPNQRPYEQESLQGVREHLFRSSAQYLTPSQVALFQGTSWEKGKEEEQMRETESMPQVMEWSNDLVTKRDKDVEERKIKSGRVVVKRLKMITAPTNPDEGDKLLQTRSRPTGGGRGAQGPDIFRHPDPRKRGQCTQTLSDDEISLCSKLLDKEIKRFLKPPSASKPSSSRCAVFSLTPLKRPCPTEGSNIDKQLVHRNLEKSFLPKNPSSRQRQRRNWSADELLYLSEGVKRFGHSWNSILFAYPFHPTRTNVDLAKKYRQMQRAKVQGLDLSDARNL